MAGSLAHDDRDLDEMHEINVTPFIDVMLVLLIIFMVAAPLATVQIEVELPRISAEEKPQPSHPVFLTIRNDHTLALNGASVSPSEMLSALDEATFGDRTTRIFVRADKAISYGYLMDVMSDLNAAGYLTVALVALEKVPPE